MFRHQACHQPCQRLPRVVGEALPKRGLRRDRGPAVREQFELRRRHFARHRPTSESRVQSPMLRQRGMGSRIY